MARPRRGEEQVAETTIAAKLPRTMVEALRNEAAQGDRMLSGQIRLALREWLARRVEERGA